MAVHFILLGPAGPGIEPLLLSGDASTSIPSNASLKIVTGWKAGIYTRAVEDADWSKLVNSPDKALELSPTQGGRLQGYITIGPDKSARYSETWNEPTEHSTLIDLSDMSYRQRGKWIPIPKVAERDSTGQSQETKVVASRALPDSAFERLDVDPDEQDDTWDEQRGSPL